MSLTAWVKKDAGKKNASKGLEKSRMNPSYDNLAKNFAELTGISESQQQFRTCTFCAENLQKRDIRVTITTENQSPVLQRYYEKLRQLMSDGTKMSKEYRAIAQKLNDGEPATKLDIEEATHLRIRLLKAAENVGAVAKAVVALDEDPATKTLRSRIHSAAMNFVKETLVGLPGIPTEAELKRLQHERKKAAATAKLRYEQEIAKRSAKLSATAVNPFGVSGNKRTSPQSQRRSKKKAPSVQYGNGFVSSTSRAKQIDTDDPILLQIGNLREFISQARAAGKEEDARLLEENLRDLQEEYQRQRQQLEENYNDFKDVFGKKPEDGETLNDFSNESPVEEDEFDENNPFFVGPENEMREIEQALKSEQTSISPQWLNDAKTDYEETNAIKKTEVENEDRKIIDGSIDFDEYDKSGRNPFF